jgi:hypothetical protein
MVAYPQNRVLIVCLGIGLLLRDLHAIQFELGGDDEEFTSTDPALAPLQKSKLDWAHTQVLLQLCQTIAGDLKECMDELQKSRSHQGAKRPLAVEQPASKRQKKDPAR